MTLGQRKLRGRRLFKLILEMGHHHHLETTHNCIGRLELHKIHLTLLLLIHCCCPDPSNQSLQCRVMTYHTVISPHLSNTSELFSRLMAQLLSSKQSVCMYTRIKASNFDVPPLYFLSIRLINYKSVIWYDAETLYFLIDSLIPRLAVFSPWLGRVTPDPAHAQPAVL